MWTSITCARRSRASISRDIAPRGHAKRLMANEVELDYANGFSPEKGKHDMPVLRAIVNSKSKRAGLQMERYDLEILMSALEISAVRLTECFVGPGWRAELAAVDMPTLFYISAGAGQISIGQGSPLAFGPDMLLIAPPRQAVRIDARDDHGPPRVVDVQWRSDAISAAGGRLVVGNGPAAALLIVAHFRGVYGASINPFAGLPCAIVEQFAEADELGRRLKAAVLEFDARQVGMRAMTNTLLKQVLIVLFRRSLSSTICPPGWLVAMRDPRVARAFAEMCSRPCASHSVQSLSRIAGLSRSVFMTRFPAAVGVSPGGALRQLRMQHAAAMMSVGGVSLKQIARATGYSSRSSFLRAFKQTYGHGLVDHREAVIEGMRLEDCFPDRNPLLERSSATHANRNGEIPIATSDSCLKRSALSSTGHIRPQTGA
jgi:AraC family transcriptional regulator, activator of mtrCDE